MPAGPGRRAPEPPALQTSRRTRKTGSRRTTRSSRACGPTAPDQGGCRPRAEPQAIRAGAARPAREFVGEGADQALREGAGASGTHQGTLSRAPRCLCRFGTPEGPGGSVQTCLPSKSRPSAARRPIAARSPSTPSSLVERASDSWAFNYPVWNSAETGTSAGRTGCRRPVCSPPDFGGESGCGLRLGIGCYTATPLKSCRRQASDHDDQRCEPRTAPPTNPFASSRIRGTARRGRRARCIPRTGRPKREREVHFAGCGRDDWRHRHLSFPWLRARKINEACVRSLR